MRLVDSFLCAITACVAATASAGAPPLVSDAEALVAEMRSDAFATSAAGLALEEGKWNKVSVVCDRQSVFVEVNGVKGKPAYAAKLLTEFLDRIMFGIDICDPNGYVSPLPGFLREMRKSGAISEQVFRKVARENHIRELKL